MKHYGKFLNDAGRSVLTYSDDIEILFLRKEKLLHELKKLDDIINKEEKDFLNFIQSDWTNEEIQEAQEKCKIYNKNN